MLDTASTTLDCIDTDANAFEIDNNIISRTLAKNLLFDKKSYALKSYIAHFIARSNPDFKELLNTVAKELMKADPSYHEGLRNKFFKQAEKDARIKEFKKSIIKDIEANFSQVEYQRNRLLSQYGFDAMSLKNAIELPSQYIEESTNQNGDVKKYLSASFFIDAIEKIEVDVKYLDLRLDTGAGKSTARDRALKWLNNHENPFYRNFNLETINGRATYTKGFDTPFYTKELGCNNQYNKDGDNHNIKPTSVKSRGNRHVFTINHLPKVWELVGESWRKHECYNVTVIDEFITVLDQLNGEACSEFPYVIPALREMLEHSDLVIIMDANLSDGAIDFFRKHLALDASNNNFITYNFNLGRWKHVNCFWLDNIFAFKGKWISLNRDNITAKLLGKETGLAIHSNIRGQLNNHINFLIEQLSCKVSGKETLIDSNLKQALKQRKIVYRLAIATKTPATGKKQAVTHCTVYQFDYSKLNAKGVVEPQIFKEGHRLGMKFVELAAKPAILNEKGIDVFAFSPVIQEGISFDLHKRFKTIFAFFEPFEKASGADGAWQSLGRFRDVQNMYIYTADKLAVNNGGTLLGELILKSSHFEEMCLADLDVRKQIAQQYTATTPIAENQDLLNILCDWEAYAQLDKVLFTTRLQNLVKANVGNFRVVSYVKDAPMFGVPEINAFLKKLLQYKLYSNEQLAEIEESRKTNKGVCKLKWYDTYAFQHTIYAQEIAVDPLVDIGKSLVYLEVDSDNNIQTSDCPYCKLSKEDKYAALQFAEKLKNKRETIERASAFLEFSSPDNVKGNLSKIALMKSVYIDSDTGQLTYRQKLSSKNIEQEIRKQSNEAHVLAFLMNETGVKAVDDLYNLDSEQLPLLDTKIARKILGKDGKEAKRPVAQVNSALKRLSFDVGENQNWKRNDKRGSRAYQVITTPQTEIIATRKIDTSKFELEKLNKASEKFEKMFEAMFNDG